MDKFKQALSKLPPWLLSILVSGAILWLTLAPDPLPTDCFPLFRGVDKVVHALMFGGMTFCLLVDASRYRQWHVLRIRTIWILAAVATASGVAIEFLQQMSGRAFELADMGADAAGCAVVALLWMLVRTSKRPSGNEY